MSGDTNRVRTTPAQKVILLLFGVLLLAGAEGVLRLAGVGGATTLFVKEKDRTGRAVYVTNNALNRRLFFPVTSDEGNFPRPQIPLARFPVKKDPDTFRFFVVGASSSVAMPYAPNVAFASHLKEMVAAGLPGRKVEMINASMTAVSSYQVGRWVSEILGRYDPDLLVVYTGHNEFYGVLGAGSAMSVGTNRVFTRFFQHLQDRAFYSLIAGLLEKTWRPSPDGPKAQPLESLTKNREIRIDSELHRTVERNFRANLDEMIRRASKKSVPMLVCTPVSNRAACAPMGPVHRFDFPEEERSRYDRLVRSGDARARLGEWPKAEREYLEALAVDSTEAGLLYRLGVVYEGWERYDEAHRFFDRALLRDGVRLRASDRIVDVVRDAVRRGAEESDVRLVDVIRRFESESTGGLVGSGLILEHIHMNGRGHYLAASEAYETLLENRLIDRLGPAGRLTFEEASRRVGYAELDRAYASSFMQIMLRRWPFKGTFRDEDLIRYMEEEMNDARSKLSPIEREVFDTHPVGSTVLHLYHRVGQALIDAGEYELAAKRFRLITGMLPLLPEPYYLLALSLAGYGETEEAREMLEEAVRLNPELGAAALKETLLAPLLR